MRHFVKHMVNFCDCFASQGDDCWQSRLFALPFFCIVHIKSSDVCSINGGFLT